MISSSMEFRKRKGWMDSVDCSVRAVGNGGSHMSMHYHHKGHNSNDVLGVLRSVYAAIGLDT